MSATSYFALKCSDYSLAEKILYTLQRTIIVEVILNPQFGPYLLERHLTKNAAQMFIANKGWYAFAGQKILVVTNRDQ